MARREKREVSKKVKLSIPLAMQRNFSYRRFHAETPNRDQVRQSYVVAESPWH